MPVDLKVRELAAITKNVFSLPAVNGEYLNTLKTLYEEIAGLDEDAGAYIKGYFRDRYLQVPEFRQIPLLFFLYDATKDVFFSNAICRHAGMITDIDDFYEVFLHLERRKFLSAVPIVDDDAGMRQALMKHAGAMKALQAEKGIVFSRPSAVPGRIAIISPQILGMRHSPSREACSVACHLQKYHGCEVVVFNTNSLNYQNTSSLFSPFIANWNRDLVGDTVLKFDYMEFKPAEVRIVTSPPGRMTPEKLMDILQSIACFRPDAVISHSENLLVQELLYGNIPSLFATTGNVVPYAHSDAYWVPGNLYTEQAALVAERFGHSDFMLESMLVTPEGRAENAAARADFGISGNAYVYLVVSTRLPLELTLEFNEACNLILEQAPNSVIAFAGTNNFDPKPYFAQHHLDAGRIVNLDFQRDLPAVCAMSDAYLNPYRQGGGTSSQTAILNGLPVVTRDYGHISSVVPSSHRRKSWAEYVSYAVRLGNEPEYAASEKSLFMKHCTENLQTRSQVERIYNKLKQISARYADSGS